MTSIASNHRIRGILRLALVVLLAGAVFMPRAAFAAQGKDDAPASPPAATHRDNRFRSVDEAVAAGVVDADVADALQGKGSARALVTVAQDDVLESVRTSGKRTMATDKQAIKDMRTRFTERKAQSVRKVADVEVVSDFEFLPTTFVTIKSTGALLKLINHGEVTSVRADRKLAKGAMDAESSALVRQPQAAAAGHRGAGTYVAVLDTGIRYGHGDFGYCTANFTPSTCRAGAYEIAPNDGNLDDDGHGTNVSGIVAGIAPGTRVLGLDVFTGGSAYSNTMASAMNWLVQQRNAGYNVVAANLSIWQNGYSTPTACTDNLGFGAARAAGIIPVVISGNGSNTGGVSYPGCIPGALTVGAVYDSNVGPRGWSVCSDASSYADKVVCFSQSGPNLKMLAPGSVITAAGISQSGTSQAAPHVAGAVGVLAAAKPGAGVIAIENALVTSGPSIRDRDGRYRRRLDVPAAVNTLLGGSDVTAPVVGQPTQVLSAGSQLGTTGIPVTVRWSASDAGGIAQYALYSSTNGGAWVNQPLATATATSKTFNLLAGNTYQFAVAAKDGAGNWSGYNYSVASPVANHQETHSAISYAGGWQRLYWGSAFGGYLTSSGNRGATATFTFTGRSLAWVATKAANRGQANVYVDGVFKGTLDLYSGSTAARSAVFTQNWTSAGTHTLRIVVQGTSGRPTVDVDSFLVLR